MKLILRLILPVIFYLLNFSVYPQELWIGPSIKIDLPKKLEVSLEQQIRLDESITSYKSMFAELGIAYEINKHFKFKGAYRFTDRL